VRDLEVRQQGTYAVLRFTLPTLSTRQEPLPEIPAVEIYGAIPEPGARSNPAMRLIYTVPGEMAGSYMENGQFVFRDDMGSGAGGDRTYMVRTRAARNRASDESNVVMLRAVSPPEPVSAVRAAVYQGVVVVEWAAIGSEGATAAASSQGTYRVYRGEIAADNAESAREDLSQATFITPLRLLGETSGPPYRDNSFAWGHTYIYVVRRSALQDSGAVESANSNASVITPTEVIAPTPPQGVEAVVVAAGDQAGLYVSLSWSINAEPGVAGYIVFRSEAAPDAEAVRLHEALLGSPTFRDASVAPGRRYFYHVTAVSASGGESAPSARVEVQIPDQ
jgi:hypothetical protein